jgi:hypothetical protein
LLPFLPANSVFIPLPNRSSLRHNSLPQRTLQGGFHTVDEAAWWFITMDRSCQAQLLAEAAGSPHKIPDATAKNTCALVGSHLAGWFQFQPLFQRISRSQPDLFQ